MVSSQNNSKNITEIAFNLDQIPKILPSTVKSAVVLLHGYGSNGDNLLSLGQEWSRSLPTTAFFAPNGFESWEGITSNFGSPKAFQWFSLNGLDQTNRYPVIQKISKKLQLLLNQILTTYHLNSNKLYVVGFSQGGMLAIDCLFHNQTNYGGVIGYSTVAYPPVTLPEQNYRAPVLLVHGMQDEVLNYSFLNTSTIELAKLGFKVEALSRPNLGHSIDQTGLEAGLKFIQANLVLQANEGQRI